MLNNSYSSIFSEIQSYFKEVINNPEFVPYIIKSNLELKVWNLLIKRISLFIKLKMNPSSSQCDTTILSSIFNMLISDLKINFNFFKVIYMINDEKNKDIKDIMLLQSNLLNFMGDIKKLKLLISKSFKDVSELLRLEVAETKDAKEALRFYHYALNNNPCNTRIYSNIGCMFYLLIYNIIYLFTLSYLTLVLYREFLSDYQNSAYWFIRALSCVENDLKKVRDNLEKNFNNIRKNFTKRDYIADDNIVRLN